MRTESHAADATSHDLALRIARGCLWIIRSVLREEEWKDALTEFYEVARRELNAMNTRGPTREP